MPLDDMVEGPRNASRPRQGAVFVSIYSWALVVVGIALARLIISALHKVGWGADDITAFAGSFLFLGATALWHYAVYSGLGRHASELSPEQIETFLKANYAALLVQLAIIALSKISSVFLIERVVPLTRKQKLILFGMVAGWFVYSILAIGLQCGLPHPWRVGDGRCAHGGPIVSVIALGMLSDLFLAGWLLPTLGTLQVSQNRRLTVAVLFCARAIVPMVAGPEAWAALKFIRSKDLTWDGFYFAILSQAVTGLSLVVASLPRIKRFIDLRCGDMMGANIPDDAALTTGNSSGAKGGESLKLVPLNSNRFTTSVVSGLTGKKKKKQENISKPKAHPDWQKFISMGSTQDEHTSTSSLFDQQGVMMQKEVTVIEERRSSAGRSN